MVKVEIVDEKEKDTPTSPYISTAGSRTSSTASLSSLASSAPDTDESLSARLAALVDIVPPATRHAIATRAAASASALKATAKLVGNVVWVVTTSALLVALPLALALEDESRFVAQEREELAQRQGAEEMGSPGSSVYGAQPQGIIPPGF